VLYLLVMFGVLSFKLDCPIILSSLRPNVYLYKTRYIYRIMLQEDPLRTNYGINQPLNGAIRICNEFSDLLGFGGIRDGFRIRINETIRQGSCVCCGSRNVLFFSLNAFFSKIIIFNFSIL
jgi:hypothetical protein